MSKTDVVGTGRYKTLINQVMIQIEFFHDVRMHVDANSVMRTFSGEGLLNTLYFLHTGLSKEAWLRFLKGGIYFPTFQFERTFLVGTYITVG